MRQGVSARQSRLVCVALAPESTSSRLVLELVAVQVAARSMPSTLALFAAVGFTLPWRSFAAMGFID